MERRKMHPDEHSGKEGNLRDRQPSLGYQDFPHNSLQIMSALEILDQVPEFARCGALELKRLQSPHEDMISTNEAYRQYGRAWVEKYTRMGQLHPLCHGNKKAYSEQ